MNFKKIIYFLNFLTALGKIFFYCTIMGRATIIPRSLKTTRSEKKIFQNFFYCTIMGGATIIPHSLKTTRNENIFLQNLNI
jgi:hypothetical protein